MKKICKYSLLIGFFSLILELIFLTSQLLINGDENLPDWEIRWLGISIMMFLIPLLILTCMSIKGDIEKFINE